MNGGQVAVILDGSEAKTNDTEEDEKPMDQAHIPSVFWMQGIFFSHHQKRVIDWMFLEYSKFVFTHFCLMPFRIIDTWTCVCAIYLL